MASPELRCNPIGIIRTAMRAKFDAPRQPEIEVPQRNVIELCAGMGFEEALKDLSGFERIWLVWWFDRNSNWRPMVRVPRGDTRRRGVFATRSPHRPNPIGITSVPLIEIDGLNLVVGSSDLLDGTPILDIKPYISQVDAFLDQRQGWLEQVEAESRRAPGFSVDIAPIANEQLKWLRDHCCIDFIERAQSILERQPYPSRRHRITAPRDGIYRLSSGVWRIFFEVVRDRVIIQRIAPGFPLELLLKDGREVIPDFEAQIAFEKIWPSVF